MEDPGCSSALLDHDQGDVVVERDRIDQGTLDSRDDLVGGQSGAGGEQLREARLAVVDVRSAPLDESVGVGDDDLDRKSVV